MSEAINAARSARGLAPLQVDDRLVTAARRHAADISQHPGMLHTGSDGSAIGDRIHRAGYSAASYGEVVGWGFDGEIAPMVQWWLQSPGHAAHILDANMTDIGVGYATGLGPWGHYWVVDFAAGDSAAETWYAPVVMGGG